MSDINLNLSMFELYILETTSLVEQIEKLVIQAEHIGKFEKNEINEIFRCIHTIKGSSAVMKFDNITGLSHVIEDLFYFMRENNLERFDGSNLPNIILESIDFIRVEIEKIKSNDTLDGDATMLINTIKQAITKLKSQEMPVQNEEKEGNEFNHYFSSKVYFVEGCEMENIRAFTLITNLKEICTTIKYFPENILEDVRTIDYIREKGFLLYVKTLMPKEALLDFFNHTPFLRDLELQEMKNEEIKDIFEESESIIKEKIQTNLIKNNDKKNISMHEMQQSISVNVNKLDKLMDLVGEIVIAESMVRQNPKTQNLNHLHKITKELQDIVMAIRMIPLATTFFKMHRIVRDMSQKLSKNIELTLIGEETEVDKNIIEQISDPIMHLIRNAIDHGIEEPIERIRKGKNESGQITLEAQNYGSDVFIRVKDDGKGLDQEKIITKALEKNLIASRDEVLSERDIFNLILTPGFSTKENVTEFSGRGVGMDVVGSNIKQLGGSIFVDSIKDKGTTITMKIPLTLAIIDGMNVKVGDARYTIPTISIREAFRPLPENCIRDTKNNEMIMVRGKCYPILRLHEFYGVETKIVDFSEGILVMVEQAEVEMCLFVDELIGQQQVVVKSLPTYIKKSKNIRGLSGCTLLGDGSISLILDISQLNT